MLGNYKNKYLKYKKKYIELSGGKFFGKGTSGSVFGEPSINFKNSVELTLYVGDANDIVSKIFRDKQKYENEFTLYKNLIEKFPLIITSKNYMLPLKHGIIDKTHFLLLLQNLSWKQTAFLSSANNKFITDYFIYQITFLKGTKIDFLLIDFLSKIKELKIILEYNMTSNLYLFDFKLDNLVEHNGKIKIIDFSDMYFYDSSKTFTEIVSFLYRTTYLQYYRNYILCSLLKEIICNYDNILLNNLDYRPEVEVYEYNLTIIRTKLEQILSYQHIGMNVINLKILRYNNTDGDIIEETKDLTLQFILEQIILYHNNNNPSKTLFNLHQQKFLPLLIFKTFGPGKSLLTLTEAEQKNLFMLFQYLT